MPQRFDAIVVGAGQSGPFLAARFAQAGRKVAPADVWIHPTVTELLPTLFDGLKPLG